MEFVLSGVHDITDVTLNDFANSNVTSGCGRLKKNALQNVAVEGRAHYFWFSTTLQAAGSRRGTKQENNGNA